mgnify:CR=1 FL=1
MVLNVYIDSDVMVASEIKGERNHIESKKFMEYVLKSKKADVMFFTSIFTFLELASAMIRRTNKPDKAYSLLYRVRKSWKKFINPLPPMEKITSFTSLIDELIETSINFKTPAGDTIHAHTYANNKMDYFITWNTKHFNGMKKSIKKIKILTPTDILKEFEKIKKDSQGDFTSTFIETFAKVSELKKKVIR